MGNNYWARRKHLELKIGTSLTLEPTYTERVEKFHCKIVEMDSNNIYIDYPINTLTKKTAYLIDGAQFRATFQIGNDISYAFNTEVLGRKVANIPMIMLAYPPEEEFIKIQRREFVRVKTPVDVAVEFNKQHYQFVTEDISAGGLALILKMGVTFNEGDIVRLTVVLPYKNREIHYVQTDAQVVRVFEKNGIKFASLQYIEVDDLHKQYIVRFCFERQLSIHNGEIRRT